jgi:transposase
MLTIARSEVTVSRLELERLKLMLAKARREVETKAEMAAPEAAKEKRARTPRPPRKPLPDNLPVERIVEPPLCACGKCGGVRLRKLGEVVSKTLECEPRR